LLLLPVWRRISAEAELGRLQEAALVAMHIFSVAEGLLFPVFIWDEKDECLRQADDAGFSYKKAKGNAIKISSTWQPAALSCALIVTVLSTPEDLRRFLVGLIGFICDFVFVCYLRVAFHPAVGDDNEDGLPISLKSIATGLFAFGVLAWAFTQSFFRLMFFAAAAYAKAGITLLLLVILAALLSVSILSALATACGWHSAYAQPPFCLEAGLMTLEAQSPEDSSGKKGRVIRCRNKDACWIEYRGQEVQWALTNVALGPSSSQQAQQLADLRLGVQATEEKVSHEGGGVTAMRDLQEIQSRQWFVLPLLKDREGTGGETGNDDDDSVDSCTIPAHNTFEGLYESLRFEQDEQHTTASSSTTPHLLLSLKHTRQRVAGVSSTGGESAGGASPQEGGGEVECQVQREQLRPGQQMPHPGNCPALFLVQFCRR
jgi:hypothetical protein